MAAQADEGDVPLTLWEYLDRKGERKTALLQERWENNAAGSSANIRDAIGIFLILSFISLVFLLVFQKVPPDNEQTFTYMLGQLSGFVSAVVALHYVQKAGEKELDKQRVDNTTEALDAIKAAYEASPPTKTGGVVAAAAHKVADAAVNEAEDIAGKPKKKEK